MFPTPRIPASFLTLPLMANLLEKLSWNCSKIPCPLPRKTFELSAREKTARAKHPERNCTTRAVHFTVLVSDFECTNALMTKHPLEMIFVETWDHCSTKPNTYPLHATPPIFFFSFKQTVPAFMCQGALKIYKGVLLELFFFYLVYFVFSWLQNSLILSCLLFTPTPNINNNNNNIIAHNNIQNNIRNTPLCVCFRWRFHSW